MSTSLIPIKKKQNTPGYVYLIRSPQCKNCYKIGSTGHIYNRMKNVSGSFNIELIAYGYASDRTLIEYEIQDLLREFNNNQIYCHLPSPKKINYQFAGDLNSTEHFIFKTQEVCNAIMLFDLLCSAVQLGSPRSEFMINPNYNPVGFGEELQKFYDAGQRRFVPYPTQFSHGHPVFADVEEWDTMPYTKVPERMG